MQRSITSLEACTKKKVEVIISRPVPRLHMDSIPRPQLLAGHQGMLMQLPPHFYPPRDPNFRSDREHLSDLEHKLLEARQRFQDLKDEKLCANLVKVCGCSCCPHQFVRARDQHKMASMCTGMSDSRSSAETSRRSHGNMNQPFHPQQLASSEPLIGGPAEHASASAEGLLLAVDKFLSAKESNKLKFN